jgi:hypothetical protein
MGEVLHHIQSWFATFGLSSLLTPEMAFIGVALVNTDDITGQC